eukprot:Macronucleus_4849.p1 GENE.Macronucleus_4849~~Macronucleus_4849.p1  ORF type:complete len:183 (+),score=50.91 Macronucleus_4849:1-549(+)
MLRKKKQVERVEEENKDGAAAAPKRMPGQIRLQKDLTELDKPPFVDMHIDPTKLMEVTLDIDFKNERESIWHGGKYNFSITHPPEYPHKPPIAHCNTPVYHPNIDTQGAVCLNILRADWKPVLDLGNVIDGLIFLFLEPNPNDPLNHEAAAEFRENPSRFKQNVQRSLRGERVNGVQYPRMV